MANTFQGLYETSFCPAKVDLEKLIESGDGILADSSSKHNVKNAKCVNCVILSSEDYVSASDETFGIDQSVLTKSMEGLSRGIYKVEFVYSAILQQKLTFDENIVSIWKQSSPMKGKRNSPASAGGAKTGAVKSKK